MMGRYKHLGLILDDTVSWRAHVHRLSKSLAPICGLLRKLSYFIPTKIHLNIYFAHVHSKFQYLVSIWESAPKTVIQKLIVSQSKAIKSVYKLPHMFPTIQLYTENTKHILPVQALHDFRSIVYIFKITRLAGTHSNQQLRRHSHSHNTRRSNNFQ